MQGPKGQLSPAITLVPSPLGAKLPHGPNQWLRLDRQLGLLHTSAVSSLTSIHVQRMHHLSQISFPVYVRLRGGGVRRSVTTTRISQRCV